MGSCWQVRPGARACSPPSARTVMVISRRLAIRTGPMLDILPSPATAGPAPPRGCEAGPLQVAGGRRRRPAAMTRHPPRGGRPAGSRSTPDSPGRLPEFGRRPLVKYRGQRANRTLQLSAANAHDPSPPDMGQSRCSHNPGATAPRRHYGALQECLGGPAIIDGYGVIGRRPRPSTRASAVSSTRSPFRSRPNIRVGRFRAADLDG
jgi:hypothetical protein